MQSLFKTHIISNFSFLNQKKLLLAVSGGIDSMVLVHLIHQLGFDLAVAHCNFKLRENESDTDENFVKNECKKLKIPVFTVSFDTKTFANDYKLSIQLAARKLRYDWFYELLETENFDYILTAHHLNDSLETFLINFIRGTGLEGLTGIPSQNDKVIRTMLPFSREEIELLANQNNIKWREDSSNNSDKYFRNKLRHNVIPTFQELQPNMLSSFQNTLENLQQSQSLVDDASKLVYKIVVDEYDDLIKIKLDELLKLPNYKAYLYQWLSEYGFTAWKDIYQLVDANSGKQIFSENYLLLKDRKYLILSKREEIIENHVYAIQNKSKIVNFPIKLSLCNVSNISNADSNCIFVDENKLKFPLAIRKWDDGDYFFPIGMKGKKKISKYFKDQKLSLIEKSKIWLLCSDNQIVWVIGMRQDDRYKIENNTKKIIQIKLQ